MEDTNMDIKMIVMKDIIFNLNNLVAYAKITIPETMQTPVYYAISLFLSNVHDPIMLTYNTIEERDKEYSHITTTISKSIA